MSKHLFRTAVAVSAVLVMTACSEAPPVETKTEPEAKKEASVEPVTGKTAFYEMYKPARSWSPDLEVLSLASEEVPGFKVEGGKAAMWTCVFVSPAKREARTFTYSIADDLPRIHKGVTMGGSQGWTGPTPHSQPFQMNEVSYNSDSAYQTALKKAGPWIKKNPDKPVSFFLGKAARFPAPVWYILWGTKKTGYSVFINGATGAAMSGK